MIAPLPMRAYALEERFGSGPWRHKDDFARVDDALRWMQYEADYDEPGERSGRWSSFRVVDNESGAVIREVHG